MRLNMLNTLDVTISGYPIDECQDPAGYWHVLSYNGSHEFWHFYRSPQKFTINLVNIEKFSELEFPVIDTVNFTEKPMSKFKKWFYKGWLDLYDIDIKVSKMKKVTYVKMRSGESYMIDESAECLKNALDGCVWTAEFLKSIER